MLTVWLAVICIWFLSLLIWSVLKRSMLYWKDRGVAHRRPLPIIGNYLDVLTLKKNAFNIYDELYKEFPNEPMVGLYEFMTPTLVLRDPALIEDVLIKNFTAYPDHGDFIVNSSSSLYNGLFLLKGDRWRALRNKLLSTFTTGRMRSIFTGITQCCEEFLAKAPEKMDRFSFSDIAVDAFMMSLFGVKLTPEAQTEFRNETKLMFEVPLFRYAQQIFINYFPKIANSLNAKFMSEARDNYIISIINTILDNREKSGNKRHDFVEVLLELRNSKKLNIFSRENSKFEATFAVDNKLVLCQAFMFFFAGMDTTSLSMLYTAFHLAQNPDVQEKARMEIRKVHKKHGGFTFDAIREMKYFEQCIQESLRLNPTLVFLMRCVEKETMIGGIHLNKGTRIIIPIYCLQMDPKFFPNPDQYDPDRFHDANQRNKFTHLPFSDGPRVCAGKKFSIIEISTIFAYILDQFELSLDPKTKLPLEYESKAIFFTPKNPVVIRLSKIK